VEALVAAAARPRDGSGGLVHRLDPFASPRLATRRCRKDDPATRPVRRRRGKPEGFSRTSKRHHGGRLRLDDHDATTAFLRAPLAVPAGSPMAKPAPVAGSPAPGGSADRPPQESPQEPRQLRPEVCPVDMPTLPPDAPRPTVGTHKGAAVAGRVKRPPRELAPEPKTEGRSSGNFRPRGHPPARQRPLPARHGEAQGFQREPVGKTAGNRPASPRLTTRPPDGRRLDTTAEGQGTGQPVARGCNLLRYSLRLARIDLNCRRKA